MLIEHAGKAPTIDPTAHVAPNAVVCGDVTIGPGTAVGFGAVLTAESGPITIGIDCVIMENVVIRGCLRFPVHIGDHVLVGPHAYLSGCTVADEVFLATRSSVFNGAKIGARAEVRVGATVHLLTQLEAAVTVPIGWIAVGDPARILPPDRHDEIWAVQEPLNFPKAVFGVERPPLGESNMAQIAERYATLLHRHRDDRIIDE